MSVVSRIDTAKQYWPQRAEGLPSGQRLVRAFPRFSDQPLRHAPAPSAPALTVRVDGDIVASFDAEQFDDAPRVERVHDFHCVTTWTFPAVRWSGWSLAELLQGAGVDRHALPAYAKAVGGDRRHAVFLTEDLLDPSVFVADRLDGEALGQRHGGPIRLVAPKQYGYKNAKHLEAIDFSAIRPEGSFGPKEHLRARVGLEERHSKLPNWLIRWPYRLTVVPTALAGDRGLANSPQE